MNDASIDAGWLRSTVGVRVASDLALVRVRGEDARSWLNGQLTNDVTRLSPGSPVLGLFLSTKGRILAEAVALEDAEGLAFLTSAEAWPTLRSHLERYIIMEDVELLDAPPVAALFACGPAAQALGPALQDAHAFDALATQPSETPGGRLRVIPRDALDGALPDLEAAARALDGGLVSEAGFELARLRVGRPRFGVDFGETSYPHEAGLERVAVSFKKGCYLGQEVVCMLESRGQLSRRLVRLDAEIPLARGATLVDAAGVEVGAVTSCAPDPETGRALALGYVKRALAAADVALVSPGVPGSAIVAGSAGIPVRVVAPAMG